MTDQQPAPPTQPEQDSGDRSDPSDPVVAARLAEIDARFGAGLSLEQRTQVRRRIERALTLATALRATPLTNADEPEIVFAPFRGDA